MKMIRRSLLLAGRASALLGGAASSSQAASVLSMPIRSLRRLIVPMALLILGLGLAPATARAGFIFFTSNGDFQNGLNDAGLTDENVLFNGPGTISGPALTVSGRTNQTDILVGITGEEDLITPASGQARVEAEDGAFTIATIAPIDPSLAFSSLSFQVNPTDQSGGTLTLEVENQFGVLAMFAQDITPGLVFFGVIATDGQVIERGTITVDGNTIADIRQIRVGVVPEPASLALLGIGLCGLLSYRRFQRLLPGA